MRFDRSETGGQQIIATMWAFNDQTVCRNENRSDDAVA
jgi:hypothetical protein